MNTLYPKPTRTSYSALTSFEACPLSYKLYYLDGIKETGPKPAADRGTRLHLAMERYLKGEIEVNQLSIDFRKIKGLLEECRSMGAKAEETWLCTDDGTYQEVEDEHTRFKAIVDLHYVVGKRLVIKDLKTGRAYPEHYDQLQAYAALGLSRYPEVDEVEVSALYLEGEAQPAIYGRVMHPHLVAFWKGRWDLLFNTDEYPATPSVDSCRWCPYRASKMGHCIYG